MLTMVSLRQCNNSSYHVCNQVRTADASMNSIKSFQWDSMTPSDATFLIDSLDEVNTFSITIMASESNVALGKSTMKFKDLHELAEIWVPVVSRNSTGLKLRILCSFVDEVLSILLSKVHNNSTLSIHLGT